MCNLFVVLEARLSELGMRPHTMEIKCLAPVDSQPSIAVASNHGVAPSSQHPAAPMQLGNELTV